MSSSVTLVPTSKLRWFGVKGHDLLQQWWSDPLEVSGKGEWREIPRVFEERKPYSRPDGSRVGITNDEIVFLGATK